MSEDRRTQQVSLGCGTLILIALIVIIFGRGDAKDVEREVSALRGDVRSLTESVEEQTRQVTALQQMVRQMQLEADPQPQP